MFSLVVDISGYAFTIIGVLIFHYDVLVETGRHKVYAILGELWMIMIGIGWFLISIID